MKREWKVRYKEVGEEFVRTKTCHGYVLNDALEEFVESLKDDKVFLSEIVSMKQFKSVNYFILKYSDDEDACIYNFDDESIMFDSASRVFAFDDCTPEIERFEVYLDNQEVEYYGWRPGMRFTWTYKDSNEVVWDECYPGWDH